DTQNRRGARGDLLERDAAAARRREKIIHHVAALAILQGRAGASEFAAYGIDRLLDRSPVLAGAPAPPQAIGEGFEAGPVRQNAPDTAGDVIAPAEPSGQRGIVAGEFAPQADEFRFQRAAVGIGPQAYLQQFIEAA